MKRLDFGLYGAENVFLLGSRWCSRLQRDYICIGFLVVRSVSCGRVVLEYSMLSFGT